MAEYIGGAYTVLCVDPQGNVVDRALCHCWVCAEGVIGQYKPLAAKLGDGFRVFLREATHEEEEIARQAFEVFADSGAVSLGGESIADRDLFA